MTDETSRQAANAQIQKEEIIKRVFKTRQEIRNQIKLSYNKESGRYRYLIDKNGVLVEKRRFYESDFLKHSGIDKNTIKRGYHSSSRKMVSRLIIWVNAKLSKDMRSVDTSSPTKSASDANTPYHAIVASERDAIAEKFGILEIELSEALREKRIAEQRTNEASAELKKTRDSVASLTNLLLKIGSDHGANVVSIADRNGDAACPDQSTEPR